jgi:hypothetical protein
MPQQHLGAGVDGHDRVKRARLRVAVELDEDAFQHGDCPGSSRVKNGSQEIIRSCLGQ